MQTFAVRLISSNDGSYRQSEQLWFVRSHHAGHAEESVLNHPAAPPNSKAYTRLYDEGLHRDEVTDEDLSMLLNENEPRLVRLQTFES